MTYLNEVEYDIGDDDDPTTFAEAMHYSQATLWYAAMEEELSFMAQNGVWNLIEGTSDMKPIRNKWVFKTKRDSKATMNDTRLN